MRALVKWAGGKSWLVDQFAHILPRPSDVAGYREPFTGSAAVAKYYLDKTRCALSDKNHRLMTMYRGVREDPGGVVSHLRSLAFDADTYTKVRRSFNHPSGVPMSHEIAAQFIYLNRAGFNGLYRENRRGEFNVPIGDYKNPTICDEDSIRGWSTLLQDAELSAQDWRTSTRDARPREFIFLDPPYVPKSKTSNFTAYQAGGFGPTDQEQLADELHVLNKRGCLWMLTNSSEARDLYREWYVTEADVARSINSNGKKRGAVKEIIVTNYEHHEVR